MARHEEVTSRSPSSETTTVPPAERLLLNIIDTVREALVVLDSEFRVSHTNRAFLDVFHVAREETIGESVFTLGNGQWDIPPLRALLRERLVIEREVADLEVDHVFPGIGRRIMLVNARVVVHAPDAPRVTLLAIEDVTQQRLTARRLAVQHRELQRSNAALNEFAFVASHDLQEPLRKILSFGERLESSAGAALDGPRRQYLDRMLSAATRMRSLISDLLAYSQAAVSTKPFAPTDLATIARDVIVDLETTIADCGARVDLGQLPVIDADPIQMRQLLQNLIGNALKFRREDVPPVVRLRSSTSDDGQCTISVSDNGIGIKEQHRDKIFRMFERLHSRTQYDGSGIGLAICRRIVERHAGSITVTSTTGGGTTFTIGLPVTQADVEYAP